MVDRPVVQLLVEDERMPVRTHCLLIYRDEGLALNQNDTFYWRGRNNEDGKLCKVVIERITYHTRTAMEGPHMVSLISSITLHGPVTITESA